jgi:hypothetical protein
MQSPTITIPIPHAVIPGFDELPDVIQAAIEELSKPFPIEEVKVRPGPVKRDGTAALCLAYADWWTGYLPRLNDEIGPNNWSIDLQPWGEHQIIARLTAFGGLIQKASSGSAKGETNGAQEAEAQAKKRVCAEGVLLGLCFYFLPPVWASGERIGKDFYFNAGEEQRAVYEMYRRAGLTIVHSPGITIPPDHQRDRPSASPSQRATHSRAQPTAIPRASMSIPQPMPLAAPAQERAGAARAALRSAEQRLGVAPARNGAVADRHPDQQRSTPALASDKQLELIITLLSRLRSHTTASTIDAAGVALQIHALSTMHDHTALQQATPRLTKLNASKLIDRLKALETPTTPVA